MPYVTGSASGWMTFRGARRRRAIDKGFVLSDHCDWPGLLESIKETGAEKLSAPTDTAIFFPAIYGNRAMTPAPKRRNMKANSQKWNF